MENRPAALIFDLGGVLIDWNPRHLYRKLFSDSRDMEAFLSRVCTPEWNSRQDAGRPFREGIAELVRRFPDEEHLIRAFWDRWDETVAGPIEGTVEILRRLRSDSHALYALSNWSAETFPRVRPRFEFLNWFRHIIISGSVGMCKPDPRIYRLLLRECDLQAEDCLFIDDTEDNVRAARDQGFSTILFSSPEQLNSALHREGILDPDEA